MTRRRSRCRGVSTRSRSRVRVRRWWRSSAWPSSVRSSGSLRPRRRSSSAMPSSCATASHDCGPRSRPDGSPRGGPVRSPRPPSTPPRPSPAKPLGSSTPRSPPWPVGSVRRSWTGSSRRRSGATTSQTVDPAADPEDGYLHVDPRHATIHDDDVHFAGTMRMEAELDIADALDVDRALAHGAEMRKALGSSEPLAARRAKALGDLARTQTALDLHTDGGAERQRRRPAAGCSRGRAPRPLRRIRRRPDDRVRADRPAGGGPAPRAPRPGQGLVRRLPDEGHRSSRSSTSTPSCRHRRTRCPTGSASRSSSATAPACSRGAPDRPEAATSTTSTSTTMRPKRRVGHSPGLPRPEPRRVCAGSTTASRPTPPGATHDRARGVRVDLTARPPLPTRPPRHHRDRPGRVTRPARHPAPAPTMTPPHTPRPSR